MNILATNQQFTEGFIKECFDQGLDPGQTERLHKLAVALEMTQRFPEFKEGFTESVKQGSPTAPVPPAPNAANAQLQAMLEAVKQHFFPTFTPSRPAAPALPPRAVESLTRKPPANATYGPLAPQNIAKNTGSR